MYIPNYDKQNYLPLIKFLVKKYGHCETIILVFGPTNKISVYIKLGVLVNLQSNVTAYLSAAIKFTVNLRTSIEFDWLVFKVEFPLILTTN